MRMVGALSICVNQQEARGRELGLFREVTGEGPKRRT